MTLMLSDFNSTTNYTATEALIQVCWVFLAGLIPPLFATFQVFSAQHLKRSESSEQHKINYQLETTIHAFIWVACSLTIVSLFSWPQLVHNYCGLKNFILLDEMLILSPMLLALIGSWIVQFDYQSASIPLDKRFKERIEFVSIRCRIYLAIVLLPIFLLVLIKDLWPFLGSVSPAIGTLAATIALTSLFCLMPLMISWLWSNRALAESEGRAELLALCRSHRMSVKDIRIWDTGHRIVNALVAGVFPKFRLLMMSDLLLSSFPKNELKSVLLHEAGHVRLNHLPIRIGFVLLPAFAMVCIESDQNQTMRTLIDSVWVLNHFSVDLGVLLGLIFLVYVCLITAWLSRNMEFEADLYAVGAFSKTSAPETEEIPTPAQSMSDALLRFAEQNPEQLTQRSWTHPSLMDRIEKIRDFVQKPNSATTFRRKFQGQQLIMAISILFVTVAIVIL